MATLYFSILYSFHVPLLVATLTPPSLYKTNYTTQLRRGTSFSRSDSLSNDEVERRSEASQVRKKPIYKITSFAFQFNDSAQNINKKKHNTEIKVN